MALHVLHTCPRLRPPGHYQAAPGLLDHCTLYLPKHFPEAGRPGGDKLPPRIDTCVNVKQLNVVAFGEGIGASDCCL